MSALFRSDKSQRQKMVPYMRYSSSRNTNFAESENNAITYGCFGAKLCISTGIRKYSNCVALAFFETFIIFCRCICTMGQKHQAFVIARVRPHGDASSTVPRYRCVAAFHHQWCYGRLPLHATNRFIAQIKQKDNTPIVLAELANVQSKFGIWGKEPTMPDVPCPYISFLLATTWCVDLENPGKPYGSGTSFTNATLSADMGSFDGGQCPEILRAEIGADAASCR